MTRACIYTRVSTEKQIEKFGLRIQEDKCHKMIEIKDWTFTKLYSDEGYSGTLTENERPALKQLLEDANNKLFDAVVFLSLDRLGRKATVILNLMDLFKSIKIAVVSCNDNLDSSTPIGEAMIGIMSVLAQLERDTIVQRLKEGGEYRQRLDGEIGGFLPYGYKREEGFVVIDETESNIVKLIFKMKSDGNSQVKIVKYLNDQGISSPGGKLWLPGTLCKILKKKEVYEGAIRNENQNNVRWPKIL